MIVLIAQMWPRGDRASAREIGRAYVANVGGDSIRGDYDIAVCRRGSTAVPAPIDPDGPKATRAGKVKDYPRLAYNQWRLQIRALLACFPEEKNIAATGKSLICDERALLIEPTDEQAEELGREILGDLVRFNDSIRNVGRAAWLRGARPREF